MKKEHKQSSITILDDWAYNKFRRIQPESISRLKGEYVSDTKNNGILIIKYRSGLLYMGVFETEYEAFHGLGVDLFMIASTRLEPSLLRIINFMQWTNVDFWD